MSLIFLRFITFVCLPKAFYENKLKYLIDFTHPTFTVAQINSLKICKGCATVNFTVASAASYTLLLVLMTMLIITIIYLDCAGPHLSRWYIFVSFVPAPTASRCLFFYIECVMQCFSVHSRLHTHAHTSASSSFLSFNLLLANSTNKVQLPVMMMMVMKEEDCREFSFFVCYTLCSLDSIAFLSSV